MKDGICPKCGSRVVYNNYPSGLRTLLQITFWRGVRLTTFVCTHCGYVEQYLLDKHAFAKIRNAWSLTGDSKEKRKNDIPE